MGAPVIEWIRPGVGFTPDAAASFRRAEADLGRQIGCNSSYRDYDLQMSMYLNWNCYVAGACPYPGHSRAIHPDYSIHCRGNALDSSDWTRAGFNEFMADHGWIRTAADDPTERHHFEYQWWRDNHRGRPAGSVTSTPFIDYALLRRQKENTMYIKGTSYTTVYNVFTDANGQVRMRPCLPSEESYANTGGLVVQGYDSTLTQLASDTGYGQRIVPDVAHSGLEVIKIQAPEIVTSYALWGPGYWDETTDPEIANGWARVYGDAENLTYAQWEDRKRIGTGGIKPTES